MTDLQRCMTWSNRLGTIKLLPSQVPSPVVVHNGQMFSFHTYGQVEELAGDLSRWKVVGEPGGWGVMGYRPFYPAVVVTREMLNC